MAPVLQRAEIRAPKAVWVHATGAARLNPAKWHLTDAGGNIVPVVEVLPNGADTALLVPASPLDITRVHYVALDGGTPMRVRFDGWFRTLYSGKALGAEVAPDGTATSFRVFAPRATAVKLYLYDAAEGVPARQTVAMQKDADGVFEAVLDGDLAGTWYDFTAHGPADPGNLFFEQTGAHLSDPYSRVQADATGKSRVWHATKPATPLADGRPAMQDVVAYEVHVRDFTDLLPVPDMIQGRLSAMTIPGLVNKHGEAIGFDHLLALGVNVVHLMPVQQFMSYPTPEWKAAFHDDPDMIAVGVNDENYQWGYSTTHAFAVEDRYRARGREAGIERDELRDLVQAFHDHGIAVIVDIVPNHTGEDMRGGKIPLNMNGFDRQYYYRTDDAGQHIGPYGNEVKTEDRPMVQRWLIDQCKALIGEFGIDGFRIDLAGQLDEQTLRKLKAELPDDIILYGEPWIDVTDPYIRANADWDWYKEDAPITFFQDQARDALAGSPFVLENPATDRGYAGGNTDLRGAAMKALSNDFDGESESANAGLNYLDIHDNWTLADRFARQDWDGRQGVDAGPYRIAATMLLTSQGPVVIHGGSEFMRSKGAAAEHRIVKHTATMGDIEIKGRDDTYNQRIPNQFQWDNIGASGPNDYAGMLAFWKGLIELRMSDAGAVFRRAEKTPGWYRWILPERDSLLGYVTGGRVMVLINVGGTDKAFEAVHPGPGRWRLVADGDTVDIKGLPGADAVLDGAVPQDIIVPATSVRIWVRD
ncbi:MAG: pullulanase [Alphaproteobacteria bacterium]|nr:MAG: pullulanase [Alphaproteobacteria bacterium]